MTEWDEFNQKLEAIAQEAVTVAQAIRLMVGCLDDVSAKMEIHNEIMVELNKNMAALARAAQGI
jgi:hypothetical protein